MVARCRASVLRSVASERVPAIRCALDAGGVGVPPVLDRTVTDPVSGVREDHPVVLVVGVPERGGSPFRR